MLKMQIHDVKSLCKNNKKKREDIKSKSNGMWENQQDLQKYQIGSTNKTGIRVKKRENQCWNGKCRGIKETGKKAHIIVCTLYLHT